MIEFLKETGSTNADLLQRHAAGERVSEGHWLVADRQLEGRGRRGREWFDGRGNFMGSTFVRLGPGDPDPASLALVAGLALYEVASWHAPESARLELKWPNDLMAGSAKLAGILLERGSDGVVVGIGVNLVSAPEVPDRQTSSLRDLGGMVERDIFATDLARQFDQELERWRSYGLAPIIRRWCTHAHPEGTRLRVIEPDGAEQVGRFAGLDDTGALQLRLADGALRVIHAGDVFRADEDE